jgi:hypothetical protein
MLEMYAAHCAALSRVGVIDLGDGLAPAGSGQFLGAKKAGEKAARIALALTLDKFQASQWRVGYGKSAQNNNW